MALGCDGLLLLCDELELEMDELEIDEFDFDVVVKLLLDVVRLAPLSLMLDSEEERRLPRARRLTQVVGDLSPAVRSISHQQRIKRFQ